MPSIIETLRNVLNDVGGLAVDASSLAISDDLYQNGLTSHGTVNVLVGVEEAFDVELPGTMLRRDTFASIGALRDALVTCGVQDDGADASS